MDEILEDVKKLNISELRQKLGENGVNVGPIGLTSISLFQKRLAKEIFQNRGGVLEDPIQKESVPNKTEDAVFVETKDVSKSSVSDFYYAVCLPESVEAPIPNGDQLVFSDKELALKTVKKYTGSRFKAFKKEQEAKDFSRLTAESAFQSPRRPSKEDTAGKESSSSESSPYKAPKPQDLAKLRKAIEAGNIGCFIEQAWNNPRYLVSSGDAPAIYQEGPRYTAMHVAAMKNQPEICEAILNILENPEFVAKLYAQSKQSEETMNKRIDYLVDMYLNMPDKGSCESPLHMACKFGNEKVVEVLVAHPRTDKQLKNKWGILPKDMICERCHSSTPALKKKIEDLLKGQCYVPLMRSEDNTMPPQIGQPWSPDVNKSMEMPRLTHSPRDPSMSLRACAGPMSPTDAGLFHKRWTTPPSKSQSPDQAKAYFNIKCSDSEKGMERIGRKLAHDLNIPWSEYWEFLDQFVDLTSGAGLDILDDYLKKRVWFTFVKDFKEKFGIHESDIALSTPLSKHSQQKFNADLDQSFESIFSKDSDNIAKGSCSSRPETEELKGREASGNEQKETGMEEQIASSVLSPMSELSSCFAKLKMEDSWSEKATIDSLEKSIDETDKTEEVDHKVLDNKGDKGGDEMKTQIDDNDNLTCDTTSEIRIDQEISETDDNGADKSDIVNNEAESSKSSIKRLVSVESGSTESFETAAEDVSDGEHTFCSQFSEPGNISVVIRLKQSAIISKLIEYVNVNESHSNVAFVVQVKNFVSNVGMKVNIVSVTEMDNINKLLLLEDIEVASCDGDISSVLDGDIVEIGTSQSVQDENQSVMAYLTRAVTLPQTKFIYGPQPTREDLNVSRALNEAIICPELHPHVFRWKISLNRFLKDTNYRWQSPAKQHLPLKQGSPQPSPLGKCSPHAQYGSPMAGRGQSSKDINLYILRTKLFS